MRTSRFQPMAASMLVVWAVGCSGRSFDVIVPMSDAAAHADAEPPGDVQSTPLPPDLDAGTPSILDADSDSEGSTPPVSYGEVIDGVDTLFVDAVNGSDSASGTRSAPLRSLKLALSVARAQSTILLLDGSYTLPKALTLPDGCTLAAANAGNAVIVDESHDAERGVLELLGSARLRGIRFNARGSALRAQRGELELTDVVFEADDSAGCSASALGALSLTGTVHASWRVTTNSALSAFSCLAHLTERAALELEGVTFVGSKNKVRDALFTTRDSAQLTLNGVHIEQSYATVVAAFDRSRLVIENSSSISGASETEEFARTLLNVWDSAEVAIRSSTLHGKKAADCVRLIGSTVHMDVDFAPKVSIEDSLLTDCSTGIWSFGFVTPIITLERSRVSDAKATGLDLSDGSVLDIDNSEILRSGGTGLVIGATVRGFVRARVRNTIIEGNAKSGVMTGDGGQGSSVDFGRGNDPGKNTIRNNNAGADKDHANLTNVGFSELRVFASGNIWNANTQGADPFGAYAVAPGKDSLEIPEREGGPNALVRFGGSIVVAERPCAVTRSCP